MSRETGGGRRGKWRREMENCKSHIPRGGWVHVELTYTIKMSVFCGNNKRIFLPNFHIYFVNISQLLSISGHPKVVQIPRYSTEEQNDEHVLNTWVNFLMEY